MEILCYMILKLQQKVIIYVDDVLKKEDVLIISLHIDFLQDQYAEYLFLKIKEKFNGENIFYYKSGKNYLILMLEKDDVFYALKKENINNSFFNKIRLILLDQNKNQLVQTEINEINELN